MEEEKQYITFTTETSTGEMVEMAVVSEFEFEDKYYVAASLIENDMIKEGIFIYRIKDGDEFTVEKLRNKFEYDKVSKAYLEMDESGDEE